MKKNISNSLIFDLPLIIMATTTACFTYQINQQLQLLNSPTVVAETRQPVVNDKSELPDASIKYTNAAGFKSGFQKQTNTGYRTGNKPDTIYAPSIGNECIYGNPDARLYITEYSDSECPYRK